MEYYGTLGPACASADCLAEMLEAGMAGVRLNLSHVTLKGASAQLAAFHEAAGRVGVSVKLLVHGNADGADRRETNYAGTGRHPRTGADSFVSGAGTDRAAG